MLMGRGPNVFSLFGDAGFSDSFFAPPPESWYPRCLYLRSDKKRLLKNVYFALLTCPAQELLLALYF
jgi:hypothetical protein